MGRHYSSYADARAVCPYYAGSAGLDIRCEGMDGGHKLMIRCSNGQEKAKFRARHCDNMGKYGECPLFHVHGE